MPKTIRREMSPVASARQLIATWVERDVRYAVRKTTGTGRRNPAPLSEREQQSIIAFRRTEAGSLPGRDRSVALSELSRWVPPVVAW